MNLAASTRHGIALVSGIIGKFAATGVSGLLLLLLAGANLQAEQRIIDDGWRRTKFGWENIRDWDLTPEQRELPGSVPIAPAILSPTAENLLMLSHPLAIAAALSLAAVGVLHFAAISQVRYDGGVS